MKREHPKATHHCFAYRIGTEGDLFRVSDDGEPSGSAGRPILGQIDSNGLTNIAVIVVRYFGGTLLGVPGLINAYKTCASLALSAGSRITVPVRVNCSISFDYTQLNDVMRVIRMFDCIITSQELQLFCKLSLAVPLAASEDFFIKLDQLRVEIIARP